LGEFVKCKTSKSIHKSKFIEKSDISKFLTGFQKLLPDMSVPGDGHVQPSSSVSKS
jgi:hypothetical protein